MNIVKSGFFLILIGFALVFTGAIMSARTTAFGGLVMIGPIPVVFGTSPAITLIAMVIGLLLMLAFFILRRGNA